ncbi:MAG: recombinase family protein [Oscillospiraceae bacterium]|nr:recombinase family protein [Oscillospiraceae bacterium]
MCKVYGYCRISRAVQNIERQVRNIREAFPSAHILCEAYTGTRTQGRKELEKLLRIVRPGDTIVFDAVDRMSRNAAEGIELYEKLFADGVELVFLKQHHIDTATYKKALAEAVPMTGTNVDIILAAINEYLHTLRREQIQLAFAQAEHEVEQLHQRTREGIQTARLNGKQIGLRPGTKLNIKKAAPAKEIIRKHSRTFEGTLTDAECIKLTGLARNTYYKYKKELIADI